MPATSRSVSERPMPSRLSRPQRRCASRGMRLRRRGLRSAVLLRSRGGCGNRSEFSSAHRPRRRSSVAPPRSGSPKRSPQATTPSRSSSHDVSWCGHSRSLPPARPTDCRRCPVHPLPLFPEFLPMAEIALSQTPAHVRHGSNIGQSFTRREGVLKVTGAAKFAADQHPPGMLYAMLAVSSIARGRVVFLDVAAAKAHPGVVEVITPANRPPLAQDPDERPDLFSFRLDLLQSDRVRYANQPIAIVIADTL